MAGPWEDFAQSNTDESGPWSEFSADKPAKKQNKGLIADIGTDLKRGVQQLPGAITGLADIAVGGISGKPLISNLADSAGEATGFQPSKWAKSAEAEYSPQRQAGRAEVDAAWENGTASDIAGAYLKNPMNIVGSVAESLPSMIAGGLAGRAALGIGSKAVSAGAGGVGPALPGIIARTVGTGLAPAVGAGIGEGGIMAGQAMANSLDAGVDPRTAAGYAGATGLVGGALGALGGKVAQRLGVVDPETLIAGGIGRQGSNATGLAAAKEVGKRMAGGAIAEGLFEELPQSVFEQGFQNLAQDKPLTEGMARAGVEGALAGSFMGGAFNAIPGGRYAESKINAQTKPEDGQQEPAIPPDVSLTADPSIVKQRIDAMLGLDTARMDDKGRALYEKDLAAAFNEPIGIRLDTNQNEVPFTMGEYLDSQIKIADNERAKPLRSGANQQATTRLNQLAEEEAQQHAAITQDLVRSAAQGGALSKAALTGIQTGATQMPVHPERAAIEQQMLADEAAQAELAPIERLMRKRSDEEVQRVAENENANPKMRQAAIADLQRRMATKAQPTTTSPLPQTATQFNLPENSRAAQPVQMAQEAQETNAPKTRVEQGAAPQARIKRLQAQLENTEPFTEQSSALIDALQSAVTQDAQSALNAGEMPVYKVTDHVSVAIHPSAQNPGMVQVTRYTKDGVIGDSQYNNVDDAVRQEGLTHKPRIASNEAVAVIEKSIQAEAEYQQRKNAAPVPNADAGIGVGGKSGIAKGASGIAQRQANAANNFIDSVQEQFGLSKKDAGKAWDHFVKNKLVKIDAVGGQYSLTDGRLWDGEVMRRAASGNQAQSKAKSNRRQIDATKDTLFQAIAKLGGMDTNELLSNGFDLKDISVRHAGKVIKSGKNKGQLSKPSYKSPMLDFNMPLHKKGGMTFDEMLKHLKQENYRYFPEDATLNDAINAFETQLKEKDVLTPDGVISKAEADQSAYDAAMQAEQEANDAIGYDDLSDREKALVDFHAETVYDEDNPIEAFKRGMKRDGATEDEINEAIKQTFGAQETGNNDSGGTSQGTGETRAAQGADDGLQDGEVQEGAEPDWLTGQTNEQAAAELAKRKADIAEEKRQHEELIAKDKRESNAKEKARRAAQVLAEREAAKKAEVDKAAEDFALGQEAPAPVERKVTTEDARGQQDVFAQQTLVGAFDLYKDGIIGKEIPATQVPNGNESFQYALGKTEEGGAVAIFRRKASERGTYGGWRWEAQEPAQPVRGEVGASLTKAERAATLKTLIDVYRQNRAPKEFKGLDANGNERYGYAYSPELFVKSDITGSMVRYYVTLPDGRVAHPTELFSDYTQANIDAALQKQIDADREQERNDNFERERLIGLSAPTINEANRKFNHANRYAEDQLGLVPALLTNGELYLRSRPENADKAASLLGEGWRVEAQPVKATTEAKAVEPAAQSAEQKIRAAFDALPSVSLGVAYPITVEHNGVKREFMVRQDALGKGKIPALHVVAIHQGRMIASDEKSWIAQSYKLNWKNELTEEGLPKKISDQEADEFKANFNDKPAAVDAKKEAETDDGIRYSKASEFSPDNDLIEAAKKHFMVTHDVREAGYILPDGTMLDFSGKHYANRRDWPYLKGNRNVDHRELTSENTHTNSTLEKYFDATDANDLMQEFMAKTGAMRVDFNAGVSSIMRPPTIHQIKAIGGIKGWSATSYIDPENGRIVADVEFENTTPAKVRAFFDENSGKKANKNSPLFSKASNKSWYYSQLAKAIEQAPDRVFTTGTQVKLWLAGNKSKVGIKDDEIQWTGINDYLDLQGKGKVTKADVLAYLDGNGVQVQEVIKEDGDWAVYDGEENQYFGTQREAEDYARKIGINITEDTVFRGTNRVGGYGTKYASYQLPGGTNYRELLLTLPSKPLSGKYWAEEHSSNPDYPAWYVASKRESDGETVLHGRSHPSKARAEDAIAEMEGDANNFKSVHWKERNILAHIRMNDRVDADGNKVLFIEEVQSDWGQQGKKTGFAFKYNPSDVVPAVDGAEDQSFWYFDVPGNMMQIPKSKYPTQEEARQYILREKRTSTGGIEPAPFVTDTKAWLSLAIKRITAYAAENGYDKVAFISGEQSADRYDLSKQIDSVKYAPNSDGTFNVFVLKGHEIPWSNNHATPEVLESTLGKDVAQKITGASDEGIIKGLDLKVGGEGMKAFYNQIVPQVLSDVLKKVGGKVGTVRVGIGSVEKTSDALGYDTSEIQFKRDAAGNWGVEKNPDNVVGGKILYWNGRAFVEDEGAARVFATKEEATASVTAMAQTGFTITPEMREKVAGGLPLFARNASANTDPFPRTQAESRIKSILGDKLGKVLIDSGIVTFTNKGNEYQGATYKDGSIVLNLDALNADNFDGILSHEAFHSTIRDLVGEQTYAKLMKQLENMHAMGKGAQWVKDANAAIPSDTKAEHRTEELAAYAIERYVNGAKQPNIITRWVESLLSALRTAIIRRLPFGKLKSWAVNNLQPQDLANLAIAGLKAKAREVAATSYTSAGYADARMSKTQERTVISVNPGSSEPVQYVGEAGGKISIEDFNAFVNRFKDEQPIDNYGYKQKLNDLIEEIEADWSNGSSDDYSNSFGPEDIYADLHKENDAEYFDGDGDLTDSGSRRYNELERELSTKIAKDEIGQPDRQSVSLNKAGDMAKVVHAYLEKLGLGPSAISGSGKSDSKYFSVEINREQKTVRVSDHQIPIEYQDRNGVADYEISLYDVGDEMRRDGRIESVGISEEEAAIRAVNAINEILQAQGREAMAYSRSGFNENNNPIGRDTLLRSLYYRMADLYDETDSVDDAFEAIYNESSPSEQFILRELKKDDFLGFDYPHQAISAIINEPESYDLSPTLKGAISRLGNARFSKINQTDTPAFKKWFGDSKVVDADGNPLVVYHGTTANFSAFDPRRDTVNDDGYMGVGSYFISDRMDAENYADMAQDNSPGKPRVIEAYLSINNPYRLTANSSGTYGMTRKQAIEWTDNLISMGHDGVVNAAGNEWVAFSPTQIKSAIGNNGQFDGTNPDIRYSRAQIIGDSGVQFSKINQTDTPAFKKWFGDSKVVDADGKPLVVYHGTKSDISVFKDSLTTDGGFHFGVSAQANMRTSGIGKNLMPVYLYASNLQRSKDMGGKWKLKIKAAKASGKDGIVYLNRYEGLSTDVIQRLSDNGLLDKLDRMSDSEFRRAVPEAQDSYIVFDSTQIKSAIGNNGNFDGTNPDIRYSRAQIIGDSGRQSAFDIPEPSKMDDVIYAMQDKQVDLRRVVQSIKKAGGNLTDSNNAYLQEELFHGRASKGVHDFLNNELRPLVAQMRALNVEMADFEEYLWNRHAEERNQQIAKINDQMPDGGSGIKTSDARAYLKALDPAKKSAYESLAKRINAINRSSQEILVKSGLEKQETIDAWNGAYSNYVPLHREDVDTGHVGTGKGYSIRGSASKRAVGSNKPVVDILANIAMQRERNIVRAEKNRVSNALYGLASANPNADLWEVDKAPTERVVQNKAVYKVVDDTNGVVLDEFDRMEDAERYSLNHDNTSVEQSWADKVVTRIVPGFRQQDNVIHTRINGEDHFVIMDEKNQRAIRMAQAIKNLDMDQLGKVLSNTAKATRYMAAINTQYNPVFGVVNLTRDTQGAMLNLSTTPLAGQQKKVLKYTLSALRGIYADLRDTRNGKTPSSAWEKEFEEFQKAGGQTGYRDQYSNAAERADAIAKELKSLDRNWAMKQGGAIFDWLSDYNESMENAVRLASFKAAKESGMSIQQAASLAKNLTVNFNRKGQVATQMGALYAFFNASVQGTARLAETMTGPIGKKILYGGLLLGSMQAMLLAAAGMGDDEPPEFVRERSIIIPIGDGKYVSIPMPLGFHVIPNLSRIPTEFVMSGFKDPAKRIADMFGLFADTFNPIGNAGFSLQTIAPTVIDPLAALSENRDWTGKPIAKLDRDSLNPTPGYLRAKDTATSWSRAISYGFNLLSGGTDYKKGLFSPTPDQIDYLIGQATGGVGREVSKAEQTGMSIATGEELPMHKIPLFGRFIGDTAGQSAEGGKFYASIQRINEHENEIKGLRKEGKAEEIREYIKDNPEAMLVVGANHVEREIQKLKAIKREAVKADDTERVKAIESQITNRMKMFNDRVRSLSEKNAA